MIKLVILHGWDQDSKHWRRVLMLLKDKQINTQIYDLPGFGDEKLVSDDWGIPEYSQWVVNKIQSSLLDDEKVILLGHSFGGRIASYIASSIKPIWLEGLVLYAAPSIYRPSMTVRLKIFFAKLLRLLGLKKLLNAFIKSNDEINKADLHNKGKIFRKVVPFDQTDLLPKINVKTVLIWGENDDIVNIKIAREINKLIQNAELISLKNQGHNIHIESPNLFVGKLLKVLAIFEK